MALGAGSAWSPGGGRVAHFPEMVRDFSGRELDSGEVRLGRMLFYDPILSGDSTVSCGSCHSPFHAFAHTDHALSHGIGDSVGTRNAPALFNLAWQAAFMWDGAVHDLDFQALAPLSDPREMGSNLEDVVGRLARSGHYQRVFGEVYPDGEVTGARVLRALAQFQLTLVSAESRYDDWRRGEGDLTGQEHHGYALFLQHCNACHTEPLFGGGSFASNGLPVDVELQDVGRERITGKEEDRYMFKVPSLRNLAYTYPYMHDGRFRRLHEVLAHYATGVNAEGRPSAPLQGPLGLTEAERVDLVAFLMTLNDPAFVYARDSRPVRDEK